MWEHTRSPLHLTYKPTGQEIIFRGFDDPIKLASINVLHGYLSWIWFEEATQIESYEDVEILLASIRAIPPESGIRKRFIYTFNPWSDQHWLKKKFFDKESPYTLAMTTTYRDNPYFTADDRRFYEELKESGSKLAPVICDGEWGIIEGLIYDNWEVEDFDVAEISQRMNVRFAYGLDFGYATSYTAFVAALVDPKSYDIWIYDEMYEKEMTNIAIAKRLTQMGYANERIIADCAEPKSIMELRGGFLEQNPDGTTIRYSTPNVQQARKGADSINNGISRIQMYRIHVLPRCRNVITELSCYSWEINKQGEYTGKPIKKFDHACLTGDTKIWSKEGYIPIRDIKAGMEIMSHLGWRKVLDSQLTKRSQRIWELTLKDGTVIRGTGDHAIVTADGVKYLQDISNCDEVIKWENGRLEPKESNVSKSMGSDGIGTLNQLNALRGSISEDTMCSCTDMSGKNTTEQSLKDVIYTTSMETPVTMTSPISKCSPHLSTDTNIQIQKRSVNGVESTWQTTKRNAEHGTHPKKGVSGTNSMSENTSGQSNHSHASAVVRNSRHNTTVTIDFAHPHVKQNGVVTPDSITRQEFVNAVVENSLSTNIEKQGPVLVPVQTVCATDDYEDVYNITVDEAHDYFANGVLLLNCDALRYAMEPFLSLARGFVAEAKGIDGFKPTPRPSVTSTNHSQHAKRIFATHE